MTTGRLRVNWDTCNTSSCGCVDREDPERTPDSVWECLVREFATTVYHPSGTARMGRADDPLAVLDHDLRVRGVHNLRVVRKRVYLCACPRSWQFSRATASAVRNLVACA